MDRQTASDTWIQGYVDGFLSTGRRIVRVLTMPEVLEPAMRDSPESLYRVAYERGRNDALAA
ncbi:hypothetical protein [Piscinibacter gummiphilus]|uniref:Uncharacterized protein n=1 Tax=Piscinibacter gummiphilus TaxID=946333 RepID=A0A1W6L613_9BURK|nr:hypothetical protein [Piscinibacter gummiphilus]ARN19620.1 hypothetical protein A4W93_06640 [Piscinibacter gummiphilus]ATU64289.1 hypothetical protein CPZ87_06725 [Piscinibacter gummiphilus]GLS93488.1 hypothetical protein GCM10007918_07790 [Piscinibacter gummiphilus]